MSGIEDKMIQLVNRYFSTKNLCQGEADQIPTNKEAYGLYWKLAWPCILESVLLCMVNFIDTMMVSTLGEMLLPL